MGPSPSTGPFGAIAADIATPGGLRQERRRLMLWRMGSPPSTGPFGAIAADIATPGGLRQDAAD